MVIVTNMLLNTETIAVLSLTLMASITILVMCCVCWQQKKNRMYSKEKGCGTSELPDEFGLTEITLNERDTAKFRGNNNSSYNISEKAGKIKKNYNVLVAKHQHMLKVSNLKLPSDTKLDSFGSPLLNSCNSDFVDSEFRSCASSDCSDSSKNSFFSVYPNTRKTSIAETTRSATSQVNLQDCLE